MCLWRLVIQAASLHPKTASTGLRKSLLHMHGLRGSRTVIAALQQFLTLRLLLHPQTELIGRNAFPMAADFLQRSLMGTASMWRSDMIAASSLPPTSSTPGGTMREAGGARSTISPMAAT